MYLRKEECAPVSSLSIPYNAMNHYWQRVSAADVLLRNTQTIMLGGLVVFGFLNMTAFSKPSQSLRERRSSRALLLH